MKKVMKENKGVLILAATLVIGVTLIICGSIGVLSAVASPTSGEAVSGSPVDELAIPQEEAETPAEPEEPEKISRVKKDPNQFDPSTVSKEEVEAALAIVAQYQEKLDALKAKVDAADPATTPLAELTALYKEATGFQTDYMENGVQEMGQAWMHPTVMSKDRALGVEVWNVSNDAERKYHDAKYGEVWVREGKTVTFKKSVTPVDWSNRSVLTSDEVEYYFQKLQNEAFDCAAKDLTVVLPDGRTGSLSELTFSEVLKTVYECLSLPIKEAYITYDQLAETLDDEQKWAGSKLSFEKPAPKEGQYVLRVYTLLIDDGSFKSEAEYEKALLDSFKGEVCLTAGSHQLTTTRDDGLGIPWEKMTGYPYTLFLLTADEEIGTIGFVGADTPGGNGGGWSFTGFSNTDAIL